MRHIEFIGLPAAGKTTLIEGLKRGALAGDRIILAPMKRPPATRNEKFSKLFQDISTVLRQLLGRPVRSLRIWRACSAFPQPSMSLRIRMYLNCLRADILARATLGRAAGNSLVILDQGIYQAVWSLALRADFDSRDRLIRDCRRLLGCLARPELVILVDTPAETARRRLANEPDIHGRLPDLLRSDPDWMRRAQEIIDVLWELAHGESRIGTFRYAAEEMSLTDVEQSIRRTIASSDPGRGK